MAHKENTYLLNKFRLYLNSALKKLGLVIFFLRNRVGKFFLLAISLGKVVESFPEIVINLSNSVLLFKD